VISFIRNAVTNGVSDINVAYLCFEPWNLWKCYSGLLHGYFIIKDFIASIDRSVIIWTVFTRKCSWTIWDTTRRNPAPAPLFYFFYCLVCEAIGHWCHSWSSPSATLSTTNPTYLDPGLNAGRRGGKPATYSLSYGAAFREMLVNSWVFAQLLASQEGFSSMESVLFFFWLLGKIWADFNWMRILRCPHQQIAVKFTNILYQNDMMVP
jgi:hypothetical protein